MLRYSRILIAAVLLVMTATDANAALRSIDIEVAHGDLTERQQSLQPGSRFTVIVQAIGEGAPGTCLDATVTRGGRVLGSERFPAQGTSPCFDPFVRFFDLPVLQRGDVVTVTDLAGTVLERYVFRPVKLRGACAGSRRVTMILPKLGSVVRSPRHGSISEMASTGRVVGKGRWRFRGRTAVGMLDKPLRRGHYAWAAVSLRVGRPYGTFEYTVYDSPRVKDC